MGSLFGGGSGLNPQKANVMGLTNPEQLGTAYANTQDTLAQQQALIQALQAQGGLQNQSQVYNQLQQQVAGQGPNPAQAMLNNATGQNVANQAALMAGQRGASANTGLMARQIAQQGGNLQQQAVGQGAALQAQQSTNALGMAGNLANQQASNQIGTTQGLTSAQLQAQQNLLNAGSAQNAAEVNAQNSINQANAQAGASKNNLFGNLLTAAGTVVGAIYGGPAGAAIGGAAGNAVGGALGGESLSGGPTMMAAEGGEVGPKSFLGKYAQGGQVPALVSPGERYLPPKEVEKVAQGKKAPIQAGEKIKGTPKVGGAKDSYANDTIKKTLQEGGIVLPRSVTQSKNADEKARKFVAAILAKKGKLK